MTLITLTTDFGLVDTYVGAMKGVILNIAPDAAIVDICHEIPPQDVMAGALALESAAGYFPEGTLHVAVVDPGVGGERAAVAVEARRYTYVGPDNGLFTLILRRDPVLRAVRLTNPAYRRHPVSATFHGRDVFAPAAAYLAQGVRLEELGEPVGALVSLNIPEPAESGGELTGQVLHVDRFGNLVTSVTADTWGRRSGGLDPSAVRVQVGGVGVGPIRSTYVDVAPGEPVAYFGSGGRLEIGVRNGSAAATLDAARGSAFTIRR